MFFLYSITSTLCYTINNVLLVDYARKMDGFSLAVYRNLSLAITMLPVLFFVEPGAWARLPENLWLIAIAALGGAISLAMRFLAYNSIPVGIASAINNSRVIVIALLAYFLAGEVLNFSEILNVIVILAGVVFLGFQKTKMPHLDGKHLHGYLYLGIHVIAISIAFFCFSEAARRVDPFLAGYLWEALIGFFALFIVCGRGVITGKKLQKIPFKSILKISGIVSFTVIGTASYALAIEIGDIAIASAIGTSGTVLMTIYSHYFHHEKLNLKQWGGILAVVAGVIGLKIFG